MADQIRPKDLPAGVPTPDSALIFDNGLTVNKVTPSVLVDAGAPLATQAQAEAGTDNATRMSPLRTAQAVAGKAQAAALGVPGTDSNMGTFTGSIIPDNQTAKQGMQALETKAESDYAAVPARAREVNPELPISTFMVGHEGDADHTPRFNEAIDKLNAVTGQKGGTIRLDRFRYKVGAVQAIQTGATWIRGVGAPQSVANNALAIADAMQYGTVVELLAGSGDAFTWGNQDGGSGYLFQGGGISDLTTFAAPGRTGYVANVMRVRGWTAQDMNMWRPWRGIRTYGGLGTYLRNVYADQLRGDWCFMATGDALNKGDIIDLDNCWVGAQDAATGTRGIGLVVRDYFHTVTGNVFRVVNPSIGIYTDSSLATANDNMRPFVLRFKGTEVDFAQNEAVRLVHFRDAEFVGGYYHGLGTDTVFTANSHMVSGANKNDELRIIGGKFSGAGGGIGDINLSCGSSLVTGAAFHAPSSANNNCIAVGGDATKTKIDGCAIGEVGQSVKNGTITGIRVFAGATKTEITNNSFYNCDTPVVDGATAGQTYQNGNKAW